LFVISDDEQGDGATNMGLIWNLRTEIMEIENKFV
jgi:hypothetical protein